MKNPPTPNTILRSLFPALAGVLLAGLAATAQAEDEAKEVKSEESSKKKGAVLNLFSMGIKHWKVLKDFPSNGGLEKAEEEGTFRVNTGDPLSGIRYEGPEELPLTDYEIAIEARRTKGGDFFCGLTFPVHSLKTCCTFVAGGWGGALTGISSIDGMDAANNSTSTFHNFKKDEWYKFRIRVTKKELKVWLADKPIVELELADRRLGMRWGDIEYCQPLGLATYQSTAEYRNFSIRRLDGKALPKKKTKKKKDDKAKQSGDK